MTAVTVLTKEGRGLSFWYEFGYFVKFIDMYYELI